MSGFFKVAQPERSRVTANIFLHQNILVFTTVT